MLRFVICSVGTSLLSGPGRPWRWHPREAPELPDPELVDRWLQQAAAADASAERNTLARMEVGENDRIAFLHSDTPEGEYCAERLAAFYRNRTRGVELRRIEQLGYGAKGFSRGLKSLIDITCDLIRKARERSEGVVICATGGFKAEIAYLNLLGALLQVEVVYMHELHRDLVILPRMPLAWNTEFVLRNKAFFEWIDAEPRRSVEVESWLKQEPSLRNLVEDGDDGCTYLSPAGQLLYQAALQREAPGEPVEWPQPCDQLPEKKERYFQNKPHHRPQGWERFVDRLLAIAYVESVGFYDGMYQGARVQVLDPERGLIGIRYESGGDVLPIWVATTARGEAQTRLVAEHLRRIK